MTAYGKGRRMQRGIKENKQNKNQSIIMKHQELSITDIAVYIWGPKEKGMCGKDKSQKDANKIPQKFREKILIL